MRIINPIPLRIHCWGGFGSQLHALFLATETYRIFNRRTILIFHNSGITKRELEIVPLLGNYDFKVVKDYNETQNNSRQDISSFLRNSVLKFLKKIALTMQLVSNFDNATNVSDLKFFTLSLRGHYTNLRVEEELCGDLFEKLMNISEMELGNKFKNLDNWIIHYRLGDLLHHDKDFISAKIITNFFKVNQPSGLLTVLSDSPSVALKLLTEEFERQNLKIRINSEQLSSVSTLVRCINGKNFLGTTSKISIWAAVFRLILRKGVKTAMPSNLKSNLSYLLDISNLSQIVFYG